MKTYRVKPRGLPFAFTVEANSDAQARLRGVLWLLTKHAGVGALAPMSIHLRADEPPMTEYSPAADFLAIEALLRALLLSSTERVDADLGHRRSATKARHTVSTTETPGDAEFS